MLPKEKRNAMNTVYAFCRMTDDIVDDEGLTKQLKRERLDEWRADFNNALLDQSDNSLLNELKKSIEKFNIPHQPFYDLIEGMEIDLEKDRFSTFDELKDYCYKVASTIGLMTIPIFGYSNEKTVDYAVNLGIALQLTNIIRDVKTDSLRGRIYIPQEDMERFNYSDRDLFNNLYNDDFVNLMKFQTERARKFYSAADKNLASEDKSSMFTARAMQYIYYRLLDKIQLENYNVFNDKISVSAFNKFFIAFTVWLKYKLFH